MVGTWCSVTAGSRPGLVPLGDARVPKWDTRAVGVGVVELGAGAGALTTRDGGALVDAWPPGSVIEPQPATVARVSATASVLLILTSPARPAR
jgi:hypothetical protein